MENKEKENQQDKVVSSKEQKRMDFLEYLQKTQKNKKERRKKGEVMNRSGGNTC